MTQIGNCQNRLIGQLKNTRIAALQFPDYQFWQLPICCRG
jgi:hypothetical protein